MLTLTAACIMSFPELNYNINSKPMLYTAGAFISGVLIFSMICSFMPIHVFGHEFTHWITAKVFRKKTGSFKVGLEEGHVHVDNPNIAIYLAPYIIPVFTIFWLVIYTLTIIIYKPSWHYEALFIGIGFSYAFHCVLTGKTLKTDQPDLHYAGKPFSMIIIIFTNVMILYFLLATISGNLENCLPVLWENFKSLYYWILNILKKISA